MPHDGATTATHAICTSQVMRQLWFAGLRSVPGIAVRRPWMKAREIDLLAEVIRRAAPNNCLEWGSGYSTLYFPSLLPSEGRWHAVEHDRPWAEQIASLNRRPNVAVHYVPPERDTWTDAHGDGAPEDLTRYLDFPSALGPFDLILVDGRARVACLKKAAGLLSERGVVILHDANRRYYEEGWEPYRFQALFRDHRPTVGGIWVGSLHRTLEPILDLDRQTRVWEWYRTMGPTSVGRTLHI